MSDLLLAQTFFGPAVKTGSLVAVAQAAIFAAAGGIHIDGSLDVTAEAAVFAAVGDRIVQGSMDVSAAPAIFAADGVRIVHGTADLSSQAGTTQIEANIGGVRTGDMDVSAQAAVFAADGQRIVHGVFAIQAVNSATTQISGDRIVHGGLAVTAQAADFAATGQRGVSGVLDAIVVQLGFPVKITGFVGEVVGNDHTSHSERLQTAIQPVDSRVQWDRDGTQSNSGPGSTPFPGGEWWSKEPQLQIGVDHDLKVRRVTGRIADFGNIADDTWITFIADPRFYTIRREDTDGIGIFTSTLEIQIRDKLTQTVQDTWTIILEAERTADLTTGNINVSAQAASISMAGDVAIEGQLAVTAEDATVSMTGDPIVAGTIDVSAQAASYASAGVRIVHGTADVTAQAAAFAATGQRGSTGTLAAVTNPAAFLFKAAGFVGQVVGTDRTTHSERPDTSENVVDSRMDWERDGQQNNSGIGSTPFPGGEWWSKEPVTNIGTFFDMKVRRISGRFPDFTDITDDTWQSIPAGGRFYTIRRAPSDGIGIFTSLIEVQFRDSLTQTVQDTWQITLEAQRLAEVIGGTMAVTAQAASFLAAGDDGVHGDANVTSDDASTSMTGDVAALITGTLAAVTNPAAFLFKADGFVGEVVGTDQTVTAERPQSTMNVVDSKLNFDRDGTQFHTGPASTGMNSGEWWSKEPITDIGTDFDLKVRRVTGRFPDFTNIADDTWITFIVDPRFYTIRRTQADGAGTYESVLEVQIRDKLTQTVQDTWSITLRARRTETIITGNIDVTAAAPAYASAGDRIIHGTMAVTAQDTDFAGVGDRIRSGTIDVTADDAAFAAIGDNGIHGDADVSSQAAIFLAVGLTGNLKDATLDAESQDAAFAAAGIHGLIGDADVQSDDANTSMTAIFVHTGTMAVTAQAASTSIAGDVAIEGDADVNAQDSSTAIEGEIVIPLAVSPRSTNNNQLNFQATCWSGVRYQADGDETGLHRDGVWHLARDQWLDSGAAEDVWIERTLVSGTFNVSDPGSGRKQLNTTRTFSLNQTTAGTRTVVVTFDFWDAASGGNLLDSVTIQIQATRENV